MRVLTEVQVEEVPQKVQLVRVQGIPHQLQLLKVRTVVMD
jgi:hypothetical protein